MWLILRALEPDACNIFSEFGSGPAWVGVRHYR